MEKFSALDVMLEQVKALTGAASLYFGSQIPNLQVAVVCQIIMNDAGKISVRYRKLKHGFQICRGLVSQ